jgi:hypothetical protein
MISAAIFARKRDYGKEKDFSSGKMSQHVARWRESGIIVLPIRWTEMMTC